MPSYILKIRTRNPKTAEGSRAQEEAIAAGASPWIEESRTVVVEQAAQQSRWNDYVKMWDASDELVSVSESKEVAD